MIEWIVPYTMILEASSNSHDGIYKLPLQNSIHTYKAKEKRRPAVHIHSSIVKESKSGENLILINLSE